MITIVVVGAIAPHTPDIVPPESQLLTPFGEPTLAHSKPTLCATVRLCGRSSRRALRPGTVCLRVRLFELVSPADRSHATPFPAAMRHRLARLVPAGSLPARVPPLHVHWIPLSAIQMVNIADSQLARARIDLRATQNQTGWPLIEANLCRLPSRASSPDNAPRTTTPRHPRSSSRLSTNEAHYNTSARIKSPQWRPAFVPPTTGAPNPRLLLGAIKTRTHSC